MKSTIYGKQPTLLQSTLCSGIKRSSTLLLFLYYLIEAGFSRVPQMLSKARNRLDIMKWGDLRLSLTSIEPNIKKLVEKHQPQGSH